MRPISLALLAPVVAVALSASACTGGGGGETPEPERDVTSAGTLDWKTCGRPTPEQGGDGKAPARLADGTRWECATLEVPLDYAKPGGKRIGIALIKAGAKDPGRRLGSLVYNFGGPGGSGVLILPELAKDYEKLRERWDLVGFDPRGVGASAPVTCLDDARIDEERGVDAIPDNAAEEKEVQLMTREQVQGCQSRAGDLLPYVTTTNTARDLDRIREALGDKRLNYFGISYGTQLGGVYAHLFPKRVGRTVLDAVVDPTKGGVDSARAQAKGFELALTDYMRDCAAQEAGDCPTGTGGAAGRDRLLAFLDGLESEPLPTADGRELTATDAVLGIAAALYSEESWPYLTQALQEAEQGRGDVLMALADFYLDRDDKGHYANSTSSGTAITCADTTERFTIPQARARAAEFAREAPVFGPLLGWSLLTCTDWPLDGESAHPEVSAPGAAPILVIGNTGDPATPYEGAGHMADELGVGVELTYHGEGHGAYGQSDCVDDAVNGLLLTGKVPAAGTECR
ncbi:Carboxylesterase A [Streptomyces sp. RB5]|uniref:Carboxylesterase A n=1 Tax=Streptomyces smaragdinus TaxID=2585196 RepID=A0A7K0CTE8_9ACTN|nr:alpha/beta hydrolase [Streptomyces smaragdinus]MQY16282.1 Carboxylesterase A [Streptomyces smaragdinus]